MVINNIVFNCDILDIINELKVQLSLNGINLLSKIKDGPDNVQVCCPYHKDGQEHRPSAGIRKSDGKFHCFSCGETHNLQEMISHCFGHYDDVLGRFGWNWLLKNFATVEVSSRDDINFDFNRDKRATGIEYVTEEELDSYRYIHPYMYKRKLTDEIIELFDIGYDKKSQCITFPIRDINGNCLFVARRSVNTKFFNYPHGVEKPLYGIYELYKCCNDEYRIGMDSVCDISHDIRERANFYTTEVIVTESMLDALSFWTVGKYAVALNGLGNELQFKQLRDLSCRKLILATDNDSAGLEARKRIRQNISNKIITEYVFPDGRKDANECTSEELLHLEEFF